MRILVFTEQQLSDILTGCTIDTEAKRAFLQAIVKGCSDSLCAYMYDALTSYNHAYTDVLDSGMSHVEMQNTLSVLSTAQNRLGLRTAKMCVVDPVDLLYVYHSCEMDEPVLYDDTANLLYLHNPVSGIDLTDQVIGVIKHIVDTIESHYVYSKEDTSALRMLIGHNKGRLILGIT